MAPSAVSETTPVADVRPVRRRPGRPAILSRAAILEAAARMDLQDLTLPALAAELGVTHGALYKYFRYKRDLVDALIEERSGLIAVPARGERSWQEWLAEAATALRELFASTIQPDGSVADRAEGHPLVTAIAETLTESGFDPSGVLDAYLRLSATCIGAVSFARRIARHGPFTEQVLANYMREIGIDLESAPGRMVAAAATFDLHAWFRREIAADIELIEKQLAGT